LTIHWGVYILDAFDASQARRLFPILFTAARLGGVVAGVTLDLLARPVGAINLLVVAAGFAVIAGLLSLMGRRMGAGESLTGMRAMSDGAASDEVSPSRWPWSGVRRAFDSPLVRAIAMSTAAMVLVR